LKPTTTEVQVIFNGTKVKTIDRSNFDFNQSVDAFVGRIDSIIAQKAKLLKKVSTDVTKVIRWKWLTTAKSSAKMLPMLNGFDGEEHYQQMQSDIHNTAFKNPELRNMVMHISVDVSVNTEGASHIDEASSSSVLPRSVCLFLKLILIIV
jgi:hypothetical protein